MAVIDTYLEEWPADCLSSWYGVSRFEWSRREMPAVAASDHRLPLQLMARRIDSKDVVISSQAWLLY
jgi:hypothetical protein